MSDNEFEDSTNTNTDDSKFIGMIKNTFGNLKKVLWQC
jgi:hypothetical protein